MEGRGREFSETWLIMPVKDTSRVAKWHPADLIHVNAPSSATALDSHYFMSASLHACLFPVALFCFPPSLASAEWSDDGSFS